jgi:DNA replication and repair protein RecF
VRLTHLSLSNFRNYRSLDWAPAPGLTILVGANAQGKSNLLEAIAFLAWARSPRASSDREVISWQALSDLEPVARIAARAERALGSLEVELVVRVPSERPAQESEWQAATYQKRVRVNGAFCRASDLVGRVNVALFSPGDVELVAGPPALRRRYLDMTLSQVDRRYLLELQRYQRVLVQRNHLLRRVGEGGARAEELEYWDEELARSGAAIVVRRRQAIAMLAPRAAAAHRCLSGGSEHLSITYQEGAEPSGAVASEGEAEPAVAASLRKALAAVQPRELRAGVSLLGPHRHDLAFALDGRPLAPVGSRGQQRTAALALKLAEAEFLEVVTQERPLVLLDDVLSELDGARRQQVMERAASLEQAFLTASELESVPRSLLVKATVLRVQAGAIGPPTATPG